MKYFWDLSVFFTPNTDAGSYEVNPVNVTSQNSAGKDMSPTMKDFYNTVLLENAREKSVFTQLGLKQPMKGNVCEWRKFNTFKKALAPLTEGVIPTGQNFGMTKITASITQHGDYTAVSDRLELEAYDDVIMGATEEMGATEGETYDTLTRNIIIAGNSVLYAPKVSGSSETAVTSRKALDKTALLTPTLVNRAVTWLKKNHAPTINGKYVWVIHPSQAYDLRQSKEWIDAHIYANVTPLYNGEIGELHGCRFIESTTVKVFKGEPLTEGSRTLTLRSATTSSTTVNVAEKITDDDATALAGKKFMISDGTEFTIASATAGNAGSASLTLGASASIANSTVLYPIGGGKEDLAVYGSLVMGKDAFGVLEPAGEGMEMIVKPKGTIGGPLEQFSTIGYKFCHGAKILYQDRLLRVETCSFFSDIDEEN